MFFKRAHIWLISFLSLLLVSLPMIAQSHAGEYGHGPHQHQDQNCKFALLSTSQEDGDEADHEHDDLKYPSFDDGQSKIVLDLYDHVLSDDEAIIAVLSLDKFASHPHALSLHPFETKQPSRGPPST